MRTAPQPLVDPACAWRVDGAAVDVFVVEWRDGTPAGRRHHLLRASPGDTLFGTPPLGAHAMVAIATPGGRLAPVTRDAAAVPHFLSSLTTAIATVPVPRVHAVLEPTAVLETGDQPRVVVPRSGVAWIRLCSGQARLLGDERMPIDGEAFPVASGGWIEAAPATRMEVIDDAGLDERSVWSALDRFLQLALARAVRNVRDARDREGARLERRAASERSGLGRALERLAAVSGDDDDTPAGDVDPWVAACRAVAHAMGMTLDLEPHASRPSLRDPVGAVAAAAGIRSRVVALRGAWWTEDVGPLIARRDADDHPVALLPVSARRYDLYDPATGVRTRVNEGVAATLEPLAWSLYRRLPPRPLRAWDLVRFGLHGSERDLATVVAMGSAAGLLALALPVVTGAVFDTIIPGADRSQLLVVTLLLVVAAVSGAVFQLAQSFAMQRVESRMDASLQAAVWDRLLGLPVPFFRGYSAGDLAMRSLSISEMRRLLTGSVLSSALAGIFSVFSFGLLFYYSWRLALLATAITAVMAVVTAGLGWLDVRFQREVSDASGRLSGMLLQFVNGVSKLRVSASESRAFESWAEEFGRRRDVSRRARMLGIALAVINTAMPVLGTALVFWATARLLATGDSLSTGTFFAFNAAFAQFQLAALGLGQAAVTLAGLVPLYERARPILEAVPETDRAAGDPGELSGDIEVAHVNFRYHSDTPLVLRDLSLKIPAGRFVAIVGPSGSGKSTLFRMLMGFETPESGAIYFDHQDQAHLNVEALRGQIGVVLQSGRLMTDTLFRNIVGTSSLTMEDAWAAAAMAGLEADVRAMPMGMHTMLSDGGGGLSGGQRQRVMIARAVVRRPRILLFDEATSALDNETQAIVTRSLASLQATRVVIAHRLSTIAQADYIYVMDRGAIVQEGTYEDLLRRDGPFADLARRQTV